MRHINIVRLIVVVVFCIIVSPILADNDSLTEAQLDSLYYAFYANGIEEEEDSIVRLRARRQLMNDMLTSYCETTMYHLRANLLLQNTFPSDSRIKKMLVFTSNDIYDDIAPYVLRYADDIHQTYGCEVKVKKVQGGYYQDIKDTILADSASLNGVVFIGKMPVVKFRHDTVRLSSPIYNAKPQTFPVDLYYMDLDGLWSDADGDNILDTHTGNVKPEIFVGRIYMQYGDSIAEYKRYFDRNHDYYMGKKKIAQKYALTYTYRDWDKPSFWNSVKPLYGENNYDVVKAAEFEKYNYISKLADDKYEFIQFACHSSAEWHYFDSSYAEMYSLNSDTLINAHKKALGYNLFCCKACDWTYEPCLGEAYLFGSYSSSLTLVGSTKTGSMLEFKKFYTPLGENKCMGTALLSWWHNVCGNIHTKREITWFYGLTIFGDPLIRFRFSNDCPQSRHLSFISIVNDATFTAEDSIYMDQVYELHSGDKLTLRAPHIAITGTLLCTNGSTFRATAQGCECNQAVNYMHKPQKHSSPDTDDIPASDENPQELCENVSVMNIFPNPASNQITISGLNASTCCIYNITGELMLQTNESNIDISSFPSGLYIVKSVSASNTQCGRFIKE